MISRLHLFKEFCNCRTKNNLPYTVSRCIHNVAGPGYLSQGSDSLPAGRSGDRITVGAWFSASAQTAPGAHQASYTMSTGFSPGG